MSQAIQFPSANKAGECPGYLAGDVSTTKKGLIVLQEWWGINDQIKNKGAEISRDGGFVTLVPDLYRGKVAQDREEAGHFMSDLDWQGAVQDVTGAAQYLKKLGCTKVGVTGFCMGGALTLASAALCPDLSAAVPFYGIPSPSLCDVSTIRIPVQCHFGKQDALTGFSDPESAKALEEKFKAGNVTYEFYMYDTGHAFTNNTGAGYNEAAANQALGRLYEFMKAKLA